MCGRRIIYHSRSCHSSAFRTSCAWPRARHLDGCWTWTHLMHCEHLFLFLFFSHLGARLSISCSFRWLPFWCISTLIRLTSIHSTTWMRWRLNRFCWKNPQFPFRNDNFRIAALKSNWTISLIVTHRFVVKWSTIVTAINCITATIANVSLINTPHRRFQPIHLELGVNGLDSWLQHWHKSTRMLLRSSRQHIDFAIVW